MELSLKMIAINYLSSWFLIDIIATFPIQLLIRKQQSSANKNSNLNKLARLARLPRMYKIVKLLRFLKIIKMFRFNKSLQRFLTKYRNEQAKLRLIQLLLLGIYLMHIFSCFWNLNAKIYGDMVDIK